MTPQHVLDLLRDRLDPLDADDCAPVFGDGDLNGLPAPTGRALKPAAVLAPLILHDGPPRFLLTLRSDSLPTHAGQISFPGGRVETGESLAEAALRETEEEIGVQRDFIQLIGRFDPYETVTGYAINPFVGVLMPGYSITPEPGEVADVFETPFEFLMDTANHQRHSREFQGRTRHFHAMPWEDRYIWGATAGMLKCLHARLYG